jgi:hypothetical protein
MIGQPSREVSVAVAYIQEFPIGDRSTQNYDFVAEKVGDGPFEGLIFTAARRRLGTFNARCAFARVMECPRQESNLRTRFRKPGVWWCKRSGRVGLRRRR